MTFKGFKQVLNSELNSKPHNPPTFWLTYYSVGETVQIRVVPDGVWRLAEVKSVSNKDILVKILEGTVFKGKDYTIWHAEDIRVVR